jgi:general secretion pathway protein D
MTEVEPDSVKEVINKLDVERAQVLIEAVIAEITSSDINELGIQWLGGNDKFRNPLQNRQHTFGISML